MNDTRKVSGRDHIPRFLSTRPAARASAEPNLPGSPGARCSSQTRTFPSNGSLAISPLGGAPQPHLHWPFFGVAYSLLAISRLGCSANLGYNAAYHTTSCQSWGNTKQSPDKKSSGLPAFRPAARFGLSRPYLDCIDLSTMLSLVWPLFFSRIFCCHGFHNPITKKRTILYV